MIYKKCLLIFIILSFCFFGCDSQRMQANKTEQDTDEQSISVSCSKLSIEDDILDAFLLQTKNNKEWKICLIKQTKDVIAALIVQEDMQQVTAKDRVQLKVRMTDEQYLVFYDILENKLLCQPIKERGIQQLCFYEEEEKLYIGIIYEISFAGWEEYSMKWLCCEKGTLKRLWNKVEREDPYHYWKNRKPVFDEDNTISIFVRESQEEAFEILMQNCELMAMESYDNYVSEYQWVIECEFFIEQWIEEGTFLDSETAAGKSSSSGCILPGTELVSMLFDIGETNNLSNEIYFSVGFEGAAVEIYSSSEEGNFAGTYFIVKKYSSSHQAGFQSLYIGSLDSKQGKVTQCFEYSGDHSVAKLVSRGEHQCILFYAETVYNGIPATVGGIFKAEEGKLLLDMLGEGDAFACEGYWHPCGCGKEDRNNIEAAGGLPIHRTARLEGEKLKIYRINFIFYPDSPMIMGYDLVFEREIGIEYMIDMLSES